LSTTVGLAGRALHAASTECASQVSTWDEAVAGIACQFLVRPRTSGARSEKSRQLLLVGDQPHGPGCDDDAPKLEREAICAVAHHLAWGIALRDATYSRSAEYEPVEAQSMNMTATVKCESSKVIVSCQSRSGAAKREIFTRPKEGRMGRPLRSTCGLPSWGHDKLNRILAGL